MSTTPTIDRFVDMIDSGKEFSELQEDFRHRHNVPFDFSRISPSLAREIEQGSSTFGMNQQAVFNTMLSALALACGRYTEIGASVMPKYEKPHLYVVNVANSAQGKSPAADWVFNDTVKKHMREMSMTYEAELEKLDNDTEIKTKDRERLKSSLNHFRRQCLVKNFTKEAMIQTLRNSASIVYFDELTLFWSTNCPNGPGKKDDNLPNLVQLFSDHDMTVLRMGGGHRDVFDAALSIYVHGTLDGATPFFEEKYLKNGMTYRFLFTISEPPESVEYKTLRERVAAKKTHTTSPKWFIGLFDDTFKNCFMQEGEGFRWNYDKRNRFHYTEAAAAAKRMVSSGILDHLAEEFKEDGNIVRVTMINKMHAFIDKFALLFHIIRRYENPVEETVFSMGVDTMVDETCVDLAFDYVRCVYSNWLDLATMKDSQKIDKEMTEVGERKTKATKGMKYIKEIARVLGGPGVYPLEDLPKAFSLLSKDERMKKKRYMDAYKRLIVDEGHTGLIEVVDGKIKVK